MAVFDIETDGLKPTKIHCLSYMRGAEVESLTDYQSMRDFLLNSDQLIGHDINRYDIPVCERILGIKINPKIIVDTLPISWYIYTERVLHGLEAWGKFFGREKPPIDDWENLSIEEYVHRCEEDVQINTMLWNKQKADLEKLYETPEQIGKLTDYLSFKMQCASLQEASRWRLDVDKCMEGLDALRKDKAERMEQLKDLMPSVPTKSKRTKPKKMYTQAGEITKLGEKWFDLLKENNLPSDYTGDIEVITGSKEPNPGSVPQVKAWLYSLGWVPNEFKYNRDKATGDIKKIEQINRRPPAEPGVSTSVRELFAREPGLEALDGLTVLTHRIGILTGFLRDVDDEGYIQARISGITNTMRFKHKVAVNLPAASKPYGKLIRGCLSSPYGYELCGSDMSSLEDRTKQHYMWDFDPQYVTDMRSDDFDPHLDIGLLSGIMTQEQVDAYRKDKSFGDKRHAAKTANYSCTYGASPKRLVYDSGLDLATATTLHDAYWRRNWSLNAIADSLTTKEVDGRKWVYNPVSKFWYSLRHEKDKFSTLNQSTGVFCFDTWIKYVLQVRPQLTGQFHDEIILTLKEGNREKCEKLLKWAIERTNEELKLNIQLDVDIEFGQEYSQIH